VAKRCVGFPQIRRGRSIVRELIRRWRVSLSWSFAVDPHRSVRCQEAARGGGDGESRGDRASEVDRRRQQGGVEKKGKNSKRSPKVGKRTTHHNKSHLQPLPYCRLQARHEQPDTAFDRAPNGHCTTHQLGGPTELGQAATWRGGGPLADPATDDSPSFTNACSNTVSFSPSQKIPLWDSHLPARRCWAPLGPYAGLNAFFAPGGLWCMAPLIDAKREDPTTSPRRTVVWITNAYDFLDASPAIQRLWAGVGK